MGQTFELLGSTLLSMLVLQQLCPSSPNVYETCSRCCFRCVSDEVENLSLKVLTRMPLDYLVYSADAEEKVRKYRALSTIEFLRSTLFQWWDNLSRQI